jgi:hypothetical protein
MVSMPIFDSDIVIKGLWQAAEIKRSTMVYTILDAARSKRIYSELLAFKGEFSCLYRGDMAERLAHVAPYLIKLEKADVFTKQVIDAGWGDNWGIFFTTSAPLSVLRGHFRQFLTVYDESAKSLYFRYYDPRVLRIFLPTCDQKQLSLFIGPVDRFLVEADQGDGMIEYGLENSRLIQMERRFT